jgi:tetrahydromethanopterin S-methyltransferase subunit H
MSWNHRVLKEKLNNGDDWYSVREVFYNNDGSIFAYTEKPVDIAGDSLEDLREYVQWILDCFDKDVLVDGDVNFVPRSESKDIDEKNQVP